VPRSHRTPRVLATALGLLLVGGTLAGCSGGGGAENVRFYLSKPEAIPYFRDLISDYNATYDDVNVILDSS
jgi:hypothetical protein